MEFLRFLEVEYEFKKILESLEDFLTSIEIQNLCLHSVMFNFIYLISGCRFWSAYICFLSW